MARNEDLAICIANLKGAKEKDLIRTAEALARLKHLPEYSSNAKLGRAVGVSGEMVREFLTLLSLPREVQQLLSDRVLGLEHGRRLAQINRRRPEVLREVTDAMVGMNAIDARDFATYLSKHPELPIEAAKSAVLNEKPIIHREFHVMAELAEEDYRRLYRLARSRSISVNDLVTSAVTTWLDGQHDKHE